MAHPREVDLIFAGKVPKPCFLSETCSQSPLWKRGTRDFGGKVLGFAFFVKVIICFVRK